MNRLLTLVLFIFLCSTGFAQLTGIVGEVVADHDTTGIEGLEGWKTYRIYAEFSNPLDEISAIYGDTDSPWSVNADGGFYHSGLGGDFGWTVNATIVSFIPEVAFDSWFTLHASNSNEVNGLANTIGLNETTFSSFNSGGDFEINSSIGASIFTLAGDPMGQAGDDLRVLIAQLTTETPPTGLFNLQVFGEGMQNQSYNHVGVSIAYPSTGDDVLGCTYPSGVNYNPDATADDGSCEFEGCTDTLALNFDSDATLSDESCLYLGCMDPFGIDYDATANVPGMCLYSAGGASDFDSDGLVDVTDLLLFFETYGYSCGE